MLKQRQPLAKLQLWTRFNRRGEIRPFFVSQDKLRPVAIPRVPTDPNQNPRHADDDEHCPPAPCQLHQHKSRRRDSLTDNGR